MEHNSCPICNKADADKHIDNENAVEYVICPICGSFCLTNSYKKQIQKAKDKIASFLYYKSKIQRKSRCESSFFLGTEVEYKQMKKDYETEHLITENEIDAFQPKSFAARVDTILLALGNKSKYFGDEFKLSFDEEYSLMFVSRYDENGYPLHHGIPDTQVRYIIDYLTENKYIHEKTGIGGGHILSLLADGWKRIEQIERSDNLNKNVFVSMSFADEMNPVREAIRKGITDARFSAEFLDEIIHNRQIIPEMFRLIRECRFLIMDITDPNYGAYYEAGYALGLGKEVIITCSEETFYKEYKTKEEKKYAKYLKPHFDILQKQILLWKDYDDLTLKLSKWIKALIQ